eukprot:Pgem_evm1s10225
MAELAISAKPEDSDSWATLGFILSGSKEEADRLRAADCYEHAVHLKPNTPLAAVYLNSAKQFRNSIPSDLKKLADERIKLNQ